jgi:hypothetical protein
MGKLIVVLLVIPLLIVMATRDPRGTAHLVELVFVAGARVLNAVATILDNLLGGHAG